MKYLNFLVLFAVICFVHQAYSDVYGEVVYESPDDKLPRTANEGVVRTHLPDGEERVPSVYNEGEVHY